jgi:hypothetical protein
VKSLIAVLLAIMCLLRVTPARGAVPKDLSNLRGFNYVPASVECEQIYLQNDDGEVNRDFDYAQSLNLNRGAFSLATANGCRTRPSFGIAFAS